MTEENAEYKVEMKMNEKTIDVAFEVYKSERINLFSASDDLAEARKDLEKKKIMVFADGKIDGSNDTIRKAQYAEHTFIENVAIELKERDYAKAQLRFDLASYEVSRIKLLVAFLQVK